MSKLKQASKQILQFAIPMIGARIIAMAMGLIGMIMIAHLGHEQLAAGALVSSTSSTFLIVAMSVLFSVGVIAGRLFGAERYIEVGQILRDSLLLGTIIGLVLMVIFWFLGDLLLLLHQPQHLVVLCQQYFRVYSIGILPFIWFIACMQFVTAVSKPKVVVYITVIEFLVLVFLGYGLLFGKFGLPSLGMVGMAYAGAITNWVGIISFMLYILSDQYFKQFKLTDISSNIPSYMKQLFKVGYPIAVQLAGELTAFAFATIMVGWLGEASLAAQQIALQLGFVIMMIPIGLGGAAAVLIGQAIGKNDKELIKSYGEVAILMGLGFILLIAIFYYLFPYVIIRWFGINIADPKTALTVHIATMLLAVVAISQVFDALRNIATGALRAFHDTKFPMVIGIISSWGISIPAGYVLGLWMHLGAPGIRAGFIFGWLFGAVIVLRRFYKFIFI